MSKSIVLSLDKTEVTADFVFLCKVILLLMRLQKIYRNFKLEGKKLSCVN